MKLLNFHKTVCVCVSVYVRVCACVCTSVSMSVYPCSATGTSIMQIKCSIIQLHPRPHNSLSSLLMHHSVLAQPLTTKLLCFLSPHPHIHESKRVPTHQVSFYKFKWFSEHDPSTTEPSPWDIEIFLAEGNLEAIESGKSSWCSLPFSLKNSHKRILWPSFSQISH